jgi:hypothetical protein
MKVMNNYVLVKPNMDTDTIDLGDKKDFHIDTTFEVQRHAPTEGEVIEVPEKLLFNMKPQRTSVEFDVDMELKKGDKVYFHYLTHENCASEGRLLHDKEGNVMFLVPYDQIFVSVRDEEIIPINGWLLVEPVIGDIVKSDTIEIPDTLKNKGSLKFAKVVHISTPIRKYRRFPQEADCNTVKPGDIIAYSKNADLPVQYAYYNSLESKKQYRRMQRRDTFAIIPEEILDKVEFN